MHVLTLTPVDTWRLAKGLDLGAIPFGRKLDYRGEILLACSKMRRQDIKRYNLLYTSLYWDDLSSKYPNPSDWVMDFRYQSSIFARAKLVDIFADSDGFRYFIKDVSLLPEPIHIETFSKVFPFWWEFDLEKREIVRKYPLSPENIAHFYDLCLRIERREPIPEDHPAHFMLGQDFRPRKLRQGILKTTASGWRTIYTSKWRRQFARRFGKQYVIG